MTQHRPPWRPGVLNGAGPTQRRPRARCFGGLNLRTLRVIHDDVVTPHYLHSVTLRNARGSGITTCPAPRRRVLTDDAAEHLRQMRLVTQAAAVCNFVEREIGAQHHALSEFNAPAPEKSASRNPERLLECTAKMASAQTCESRQLSYRDSSGEARIDISHDSPRAPRRQPPANPRSLVSGLKHAGSQRSDSA